MEHAIRQPSPILVHPDDIVAELGEAAMLVDTVVPPAPAPLVDPAGIISLLGSVVAPGFPTVLRADESIAELGGASLLTEAVLPSAPIIATVDPAEVVSLLGAVICPEFPTILHVNELIAELGDISILVEPMLPSALPGRRIDPAEIISALGTVVRPELPAILHVDELINELGEASMLSRQLLPPALAAPKIDPAEVVSSLGAVIIPEFSAALHVDEIIAGLGSIDNITAAVPVPLVIAPVDPACLVRELGAIVSLETPPRADIESIIAMLGNADSLCDAVLVAADSNTVVDPAQLVKDLGQVFVPDAPPARTPCVVDVVEIVYSLGCPSNYIPPLSVHDASAKCPDKLGVSDIISNLGGVFPPGLIARDASQVHAASTKAQADESADPSLGFRSAKLPRSCRAADPKCLGDVYGVKSHASLSTMDVDELIVESRSRASSLTADQQEGAYSFSKLAAALRIQPIVVCHPLLGPPRNVLFSHLC
ncbi:hypothetical protein GGI12_004600 [Dipsacomyces acuminosporus]|nr:hypothetical protein GGI12_004600 [Dipsacomyces acuminosporus]